MCLRDRPSSSAFPFWDQHDFVELEAIKAVQAFIDFLWSDDRAPAKLYIQDSYLPLILTLSNDGTYQRAMTSTEEMKELISHLANESDRHANMDW